MWARSLGQEDPLDKEMATHSSILGKFYGGGAWQAIVYKVAKESDTTYRLTNNNKEFLCMLWATFKDRRDDRYIPLSKKTSPFADC